MPESDEQVKDAHRPHEKDTKDGGVVEGDELPEEIDEEAQEVTREKLRREREARAQALTLEIVGDLPYAEVKPPENVLFVCKLNPVTEGQNAGPAVPLSLVLIRIHH
jgi:hypothetical protein